MMTFENIGQVGDIIMISVRYDENDAPASVADCLEGRYGAQVVRYNNRIDVHTVTIMCKHKYFCAENLVWLLRQHYSK